jgi:hypothetical protein
MVIQLELPIVNNTMDKHNTVPMIINVLFVFLLLDC